MPVFIHIGIDFSLTYREFIKSLVTLAFYAFLIFLLNWVTGANYMHLGKFNPLDIPFLPDIFTVWPWSYPRFVGVGIILLHIVYLSFISLKTTSKKVLHSKNKL